MINQTVIYCAIGLAAVAVILLYITWKIGKVQDL